LYVKAFSMQIGYILLTLLSDSLSLTLITSTTKENNRLYTASVVHGDWVNK